MKTLHLTTIISAAICFSSCASIVPFTDNIADSIGGEERFKDFQYYVSRTVVLDKSEDNTDASLVGGKAKYVRTINKDRVTILRSTPGIMVTHGIGRAKFGGYRLGVSFDTDDRFLVFEKESKSQYAYYILPYDSAKYGNDVYSLSFPGSGTRAHLLIKMNRREIRKQTTRTAKGRKLPK